MKKTKIFILLHIVTVFCVFTFSPAFGQEEVWLTVQDGTGHPGATDRTVDVHLKNDSEITYIEMCVCDEDDYLNVTGYEVQGRALTANCDSQGYEVNNPGYPCDGCAYIRLYSCDNPIAIGLEETFLTLSYSVSPSATQGECRDLYTESITVKDQNNMDFLPEEIGTGVCNGDFDCDGDVDGTDAFAFKADFGRGDCCTSSCNGDFDRDCDVDGTDAFAFKEDFGSIGCLCSVEFCFICADDQECDEGGSYCNGEKHCDGNGVCQTNERCPDDGTYCNGEEICFIDHCVQKYWNQPLSFDPFGSDDACEDGLYCTGILTCNESADQCDSSGLPCDPEVYVCLEEDPPDPPMCLLPDAILTLDDLDGAPGDRVNYYLWFTSETSPFNVGATITGQTSGATADIVSVDYAWGRLFIENIHDELVAFQEGEIITDDGIPPGSATVVGGSNPQYLLPADGVTAVLNNGSGEGVLGVTIDICDEEDWRYQLTCRECVSSTAGYLCSATEQANGCCHVVLSPDWIGRPPITGYTTLFEIFYDIDLDVPSGCASLTSDNVILPVSAPPPDQLYVLPDSGEFCNP